MSLEAPPDLVRNAHGLFVGIDEYPVAPRINLDGCSNDAFHLSKAASPALSTNVVLTNEQATRRAILDAVEAIMARCGAHDLFVFFCACHGAAKYGEFFLLPSDHDPRAFVGTALLFQDIANTMGSDPEVNTLTVIDACQSGAIGFDPARHNRGQRSSIAAAAAPLEISREQEFDEVGRKHGVFAYALIQQMNRLFDKGGPGSGTITAAFDGAYTFTKNVTKNQQHPLLVGTLPADLTIHARDDL